MFCGELAGGLQYAPPVKRHTGFQCQVVAQHGAHTNRVGVVVGNAEIEHGAAGGGGLDRMSQGGHLVTDSFDDDVGVVGCRQPAHPAVAGSAHRVVDSECRCEVFAVDGVDPGDAAGADRFGDVGKQQPDRALTDDRDVTPGQIR